MTGVKGYSPEVRGGLTPNIALSVQAHVHGDATWVKYGCMDYSNATVRNVSRNAGVVVRNGIGICRQFRISGESGMHMFMEENI